MAKNPEEIVRRTYYGTPPQMTQIKFWAEEKDMEISTFLHTSAAHYANSDEAAVESDHSIEGLTNEQSLIIKKLNQILHKQAHPSKNDPPEHDAAENDDAMKRMVLEKKLVVAHVILNKINHMLGDELPKRYPEKYQGLTPQMAKIPAMETSFFLLDEILSQLLKTPEGKAVAQSLIDRIT